MNYMEIKQRLKYRNEELSNRLESIKQDFDDNEDLDDVLFTIAHDTKVELANVRQAIERIDEKCFGKCKQCGNEIDADALNNDPFQTLCADCLNE